MHSFLDITFKFWAIQDNKQLLIIQDPCISCLKRLSVWFLKPTLFDVQILKAS